MGHQSVKRVHHRYTTFVFLYIDNQCWGKLLLKVMHYNIALLPKKVTNYITTLLFMESNVLHYFCITFALLFK